MKENSIEEDIKIVENYLANSAINETDSNFFKNGGWETVDLEIPKSMQHILSDYKRALKENEELKVENSKMRNIELASKNGIVKVTLEGILDMEEKIKNSIPTQKVKDKMKKDIKTNEHTILGGRRNGKTLEYGKRLGRIEMCQELLEGRK